MKKTSLRILSIILVVALFSFSTPVYAADTQAVTLNQMFDKVDGSGWTPPSNASGALAWGGSLIMDSYLNMYQITKNTKYLDKFVTYAKGTLNKRDNVLGLKDYRGLSLPAWGSSGYSTERYIWAVHTGVIVAPMANFAALVYNTPALANYKTSADVFIKAAKDAVAVHEYEWNEQGGYYIVKKGAPYVYDGTVLVNNQLMAIARADLAIYKATGEKLYLDRATRMAKIIKGNFKFDSATNSYWWYHSWGNLYNGWTAASNTSVNTPSYSGHHAVDDVSHGRIVLFGVMDFYQAGLVFTQDDLVKLGNTVQKKLIKSDGTIAKFLNGSGAPYSNAYLVSGWLQVHKYAPSLYNTSYKLLSARSRDAWVLHGVSLLNLSHYEDVNGSMPYVGYTQSSAPTSVTAKVTGTGNSLQLTWMAGSGNVNYYKVYRSQTSGQRGTLVASNVISTTWADNSVTEGQTYYYTVTSVNSAGSESAGSSQIAITPKIAPAAPTALSAAVTISSQVQLSWTKSTSTDTSFYKIYRSQTQGQQGTMVADKINTAPWTDPGVTQGQTYYYTLTAVDGAGNQSTGSNQVSINIPAPAPTPTPTPEPTPTPSPVLTPFSPSANSEQLVNGNFSGTDGWAGISGLLKTESNGNKYLSNTYNWKVYQEINVTPGAQYIINAQTRKGTSTTKARLEFIFVDNQGKFLPYSTSTNDIVYAHTGTSWENMPSTQITVPANAVKLRLYVTTNGGTGYHDFDNISVKKTNLLTNGDFSGNNGWTGLTGRINTETNGNKYLTNGYNWYVYQDVQVASNTQYFISYRVRKNSATTESRMKIYFVDSQGNNIKNINVVYTPTSGSWEYMPAQAITTPANTAKIRIYVTTNGGAGTYDFDNISLTK